ncbi:MAG TPA: DUF58 domain-containing protein, partial [Chloroflexia bacterium]|nr:DUF58 domain-containing protein [Chloroflexia bacterium]
MNTNAFRLLLLTVALYIAALTVGLRLLYYLSYVLIAVLACSWLWARLNLSALDIRRESRRQQTQVGELFEETFQVRNRSVLPKLWVEVRDHSTLPGHQAAAVISIKGNGSKRWRVRTLTRRRGLYQLGPLTAVSGDPFGLFRSWRTVPEMGELLVFPATVDLASFGLPAGELPGGTVVRGRSHSATPNASGLRQYIPGDPTNRIHWRATARQGQLMVKEFELDPTSNIWIVLDLDRGVHLSAPRMPGDVARAVGDTRMLHLQGASGDVVDSTTPHPLYLEPETEEYAVTIAASLAAHFLQGGRLVGLLATAHRPLVLPPDRGARQLNKMLRALAVARAEDPLPLAQLLAGQGAQFGRGDSLIVVTPAVDEGWVAALHEVRLRGSRATAVLIEPYTFGGQRSSILTVGALAAVDVPSYLVKRDDA